jgi:hypothetical protein
MYAEYTEADLTNSEYHLFTYDWTKQTCKANQLAILTRTKKGLWADDNSKVANKM